MNGQYETKEGFYLEALDDEREYVQMQEQERQEVLQDYWFSEIDKEAEINRAALIEAEMIERNLLDKMLVVTGVYGRSGRQYDNAHANWMCAIRAIVHLKNPNVIFEE